MKTKLLYLGVLSVLSLSAYFLIQDLFLTDESSPQDEIKLSEKTTKSAETPQSHDPSDSARKSRRLSEGSKVSKKAKNSVWGENWFKSDDPSAQERLTINQEITDLKKLYFKDRKAYLAKALELHQQNPNVPEYVAAVGDYYLNEGDKANAAVYLEKLIELKPDNYFARNTLADIHAKSGDYSKARDIYLGTINQGSDNLYAYQGYLTSSMILGKQSEAQADILKRYEANPKQTNLALTAAQVLMAQNKIKERERVLAQIQKNDPYHPIFNQVRALESLSKGDHEAVLRYGQVSVDNDVDQKRQRETLQLMLDSATALKNEKAAANIQKQLRELKGS